MDFKTSEYSITSMASSIQPRLAAASARFCCVVITRRLWCVQSYPISAVVELTRACALKGYNPEHGNKCGLARVSEAEKQGFEGTWWNDATHSSRNKLHRRRIAMRRRIGRLSHGRILRQRAAVARRRALRKSGEGSGDPVRSADPPQSHRRQ